MTKFARASITIVIIKVFEWRANRGPERSSSKVMRMIKAMLLSELIATRAALL